MTLQADESAVWPRVTPYILVGLALVQILSAQLPFAFPPAPAHDSEAYIQAAAMRMLEGDMLPYVDAVSGGGPLLSWTFASALALGDPMSYSTMRVVASVVCAANVLFLFIAGWQARCRLAGAIASLVMSYVLSIEVPGIAYTGELLANAFVLGAFACLAYALRPGRECVPLLTVGLAGALWAMGVLSKQTAVVVGLPFALWIFASSQRSHPRRRLGPLAFFAAGAATPVLMVVLRYAAAGELKSFVYYYLTYNATIYMAPFKGSLLGEYLQWLLRRAGVVIPCMGMIGWLLYRRLRGIGPTNWRTIVDDRGFAITAALCALFTSAAANAPLRDFAHYYVVAVPWLSLVLALLFTDVLARLEESGRFPLSLNVLVLLCFLSTNAVCDRNLYISADAIRPRDYPPALARSKESGGLAKPDEKSAICPHVAAHSVETDRMLVWGFDPFLYVQCRRRPASRFVYATYPSGLVWWFDDATDAEERSRIVPGALESLLSDLETTRPRIILDAPYSFLNRSLLRVPEMRAYVARHYDIGLAGGSFTVYVRRDVSP